MENAELDVALEELENRLERLRALYEQYFMGIERIEPAIPRKDIDRRIYVLRREKIRNTAKRFKLQTIISRYNTFQQYWQRICREIENGTYKRHVIRAERIAPGQLLTIAARKRLGKHAFDSVPPESGPPEAPGEVARPTLPSVRPSPSQVAAGNSLPGVAPPAGRAAPPPKPAKPAAPTAKPAAPAEASAPRAFESLDLDMDFMGDWDPTAAATRTAKPAVAVPSRMQALAPPLPPATGSSKAAPLKPAPTAQPPRAAAVPSLAKPPAVPPPPRAPLPPPRAAAAPNPGKPPVPPRSPEAEPIQPKLAPKLGAAPLARPVAAAQRPASLAKTPDAALSDARVRELHAQLIEAKRQTKDAGAVSVEGLAKSLKATEAKLREQHKNRTIDFDVVIKDGKAVLKPTVR